MELTAGRRIDEYELVEPAGVGGFSVVWRARHLVAGTDHALKFPQVDELLDHLRREASLAELISDPQVVPIEQARLDRSPPYLVMPWIAGDTLKLSLRPPTLKRMAAVVGGLGRLVALARALARLHDAGIVHGDLKPQNVMIDDRGRLHLLDLGLARVQLAARQRRSLAQSLVSVDGRSIAGTLEYLAPELLAGARPTPASDVYSLGVMLHQQLTGRPPAFGVSPRALNPYLPAGIEALLRRMLHHDPALRYRSGAELLGRLEALEAEEQRCLARRNGHARRAVFLGRMAVLRRGTRALGLALVLGALSLLMVMNVSLVLPSELLNLGTLTLVVGGFMLFWSAVLMGITTINAWMFGVPEKTYKERKGHPLWSFMMQ